MKFSSDQSFNFNILRWLGTAPYHGADVAEMLDVTDRIIAGDFESWHREFLSLAELVESEGVDMKQSSVVTIRDRAFRSASYYRAADFYLHGNKNDPRIKNTWALATEQFNLAISLLNPAAERLSIQAYGFTIPAIFYKAVEDNKPRPTILMFNGFDGSQEELLHMCGLAALQRGFNVLTFEGPGQPTVVREQNLHFRHDWENVVSPVVDFCETIAEIDMNQLGLIGISFGGYLAPRAAAFESRFRAVAVIDGLFDAFSSVTNLLTPEQKSLFDSGDDEQFNKALMNGMKSNTSLQWFMEQGMWSFGAATPYEFVERARPFTLEDVVHQIACPVLVCQAEVDHFNPGQAEKLAEALGELATLRVFTSEESAGIHSHPGASVLLNGVVLDWMTEALKKNKHERQASLA